MNDFMNFLFAHIMGCQHGESMRLFSLDGDDDGGVLRCLAHL